MNVIACHTLKRTSQPSGQTFGERRTGFHPKSQRRFRTCLQYASTITTNTHPRQITKHRAPFKSGNRQLFVSIHNAYLGTSPFCSRQVLLMAIQTCGGRNFKDIRAFLSLNTIGGQDHKLLCQT